MKIIRNEILRLMTIVGFAVMIGLLHAQETLPPVQEGIISSSSEDASGLSDYEVELKAIEMTPPASAKNVPVFGNFYSTQHLPGTASEWPPLPANIFGFPAWSLGDDIYARRPEY